MGKLNGAVVTPVAKKDSPGKQQVGNNLVSVDHKRLKKWLEEFYPESRRPRLK